MKIINPATEEVIAEVEADTAESAAKKYHQARQFQPEYAGSAYQDRHDSIARFRDLLQKEQNSLALTLTRETGKPISQARGEIGAVLARIDYFLKNTRLVMQSEIAHKDGAGLEERISWDPLGVVLNISAWNYPYFVGSNVFIPALLTGNTVIYKPSEFAAMTGARIVELLHEGGVPPHAIQLVQGGGDVGRALLEQNFDGVFFTGSYTTGKTIASSVAGRMIRTQFELGGKDPAYVRGDVNVERTAASLADGAFYNAGQSCCAVERIYVAKEIYEEFLTAFVKTVNDFKAGNPELDETYLGPLTREAQLAILKAQSDDAVRQGARLLTGGKAMEQTGYYFEPTVLADTNHEMAVMRDESFGPIIGIQAVNSDEAAIQLMNDTKYGLTASVFTEDQQAAERILQQINSGTVYWNCSDRVSPFVPWTGRGHSGLGSTLSTIGIQAFLQPRAWHLRKY